mmetsp:Transcript_10740/g.23336  ORF Transcript_10740/g.23336 Transcript_10740/m.23336 type:complete len:209 (-) Transcript_10740:218-844(-)
MQALADMGYCVSNTFINASRPHGHASQRCASAPPALKRSASSSLGPDPVEGITASPSPDRWPAEHAAPQHHHVNQEHHHPRHPGQQGHEDFNWHGITHGGVTTATTLMIHNVPRRVTVSELHWLLDTCGFVGEVDFLHLPSVERRKVNTGFAFVNFLTADAALRAMTFLNQYHFPGSKRKCRATFAKVQGKRANEQHLGDQAQFGGRS